MASLKKPTTCQCGGINFEHKFGPEQWVCVKCETVCTERPQRDSTKCRVCDAPRDSKEFKKGSNICKDCQGEYHSQYRDDNAERLKQYKHDDYQGNKDERIASVRKAVQRSPEAFIRQLMHHIQKQSNYKRKPDNRLGRNMKGSKIGGSSGLLLPITIDFDDLWNLWEIQGGKCALSRLSMTYQFNNLCSISVDRIASGHGYVSGNVQLVCKWVNLAKGRHSNVDFIDLLNRLRS